MTVRALCAFFTFALLVAQPPTSAAAAIPLQTYLSLTDVAWVSASPNGSRIAYTSEESGNWQVWVVNAGGSHRRRLTNGTDGAHGAWWVPGDEHTMLYTMSQGGSGIDQFYYVRDDRSGSVPVIFNEPNVTHVFGAFSSDGSKIAFSSNRRKQQDFDVYVLDRKSGKTRRVYTLEGTAYATAWSADSRHLLIRHVISPYDDNLYTLDLATGATRLLTPHTGQANFDSSQFTRDMRAVVCVSDLNREFHTIQRIDISSLAMHPVIDVPHDVDQVVLSPNGKRMAYIVNRDGYGEVVVADAEGRSIGQPSMPPYIAESLYFTKGGDVLLYAASGPTFPKVLWSYDLQSRKTTRILHPNYHGIPLESLVEPAIVRVRSFDGTMVPAWYFRPRSKTTNLTVLLDIHGGPEDQDRAWFYPYAQYLASRGYALLDPNIRGSAGYGRAYLHMADGRKRENAIKDIGALRDWLVHSGDAAANSIFIDGASYGGYVVLSSLYHYPLAFAGGIDIYGVPDWISFLQNTQENRAEREAVYGSPAHDRAFLESISPINHVSEIKRPVLIIAGANDTIVPVSLSKRIAEALQENRVPVALHIFPNEGHGVSNLKDLSSIYQWMIGWMQRYGQR